MGITAIQALRYGVDEVEQARKFLVDWNLEVTSGGRPVAVGRTQEGAEVEVRTKDDPSLPPPPQTGVALREIVWAVDKEDELEALATALESAGLRVARSADDSLHCIAPGGYGLGFCKSRLRKLPPVEGSVNFPGHAIRRNQRVDFAVRPRVRHLGHVAIFVPTVSVLEQLTGLFTSTLGFRTSDLYPGRGVFLRAPGSNDHHNIFLVHRPSMTGLHHMSFEVSEFHEVMMGGRHMQQQGWKTQVGPGRHTLGSNYFWYFHSPFGGSCEYYSDMDYVDDEWETRSWTYSPDVVAAWTMQVPEQSEHK